MSVQKAAREAEKNVITGINIYEHAVQVIDTTWL